MKEILFLNEEVTFKCNTLRKIMHLLLALAKVMNLTIEMTF